MEEMHFCIDLEGTVRFGLVAKCRKIAATQAATITLNKQKPSPQFEKELQNVEALSLWEDEISVKSKESDFSDSD